MLGSDKVRAQFHNAPTPAATSFNNRYEIASISRHVESLVHTEQFMYILPMLELLGKILTMEDVVFGRRRYCLDTVMQMGIWALTRISAHQHPLKAESWPATQILVVRKPSQSD